jgi:hypothetical protein
MGSWSGSSLFCLKTKKYYLDCASITGSLSACILLVVSKAPSCMFYCTTRHQRKVWIFLFVFRITVVEPGTKYTCSEIFIKFGRMLNTNTIVCSLPAMHQELPNNYCDAKTLHPSGLWTKIPQNS